MKTTSSRLPNYLVATLAVLLLTGLPLLGFTPNPAISSEPHRLWNPEARELTHQEALQWLSSYRVRGCYIPGRRVCLNFAVEALRNLVQANVKACVTVVRFNETKESHAIVTIFTKDRGELRVDFTQSQAGTLYLPRVVAISNGRYTCTPICAPRELNRTAATTPYTLGFTVRGTLHCIPISPAKKPTPLHPTK